MWHGTSSASSDVGAAEEAEALLSRGRSKQTGEESTKSNDAAAYKVTLHDVLAMVGLGHFRVSALAVMASAAFAGVAMSWAVQFVYVSAYYLTLGLSIGATGIAYTAGSTGIIFIAPFLGALSDASTSPLGRRRPLILAGLIAAVLGLGLFPFTDAIGLWLGDTSTSHPIAIGLGIAVITMAELGLNLVMVMERALLTDVLPPEELAQGNTVLAMANAVGRLLGYGVGSLDLVSVVPFLGTNIRAVSLLCAIVLAVLGAVTMTTPETPQIAPPTQGVSGAPRSVCSTVANEWKRLGGAVLRFPRSCAALFVVQFLNYSAWLTIWYYGGDWFGLSVYGGSSSDSGDDDAYALFEEGVEMASLGFFLMSVVNFGASFFITDFLLTQGPRVVWVSSLLMSAVLACCLTLVPEGGKHTAVALFALLGLPVLVTYQLPWTLLSYAVQGSPDAGLYCTIFQYAEILPFVVIGYVSATYMKVMQDNLDALFYAAAGIWTFAALLALWLVPAEMPASDPPEQEKEGAIARTA